MMHHIRRSVLDKLATASSLRYGEIKPKDLDGNVFNYHLKGLIADKLVQKDELGEYSLTPLGRDYVVRRHEDSSLSAHSIFLIVIKRNSEYLLRRRDVQPLIGYTGFIHGEPVVGVDVIEAATQRLFVKTGIQNVDLSIAGSALITQHHAGELQSFSHVIVVYGHTNDDIEVQHDTTGRNFWANPSTVQKLLPSSTDIIGMIDTHQTWLEQSYTLD